MKQDEIWITDLGVARPESALSQDRRKNCWKLLPYAIEGHEGRMLSTVSGIDPLPVRIALPEGGPYAAHIGVWNDWHSKGCCGVRVRFDGALLRRGIVPVDQAPKDAAEEAVKGIGLNTTRIEDVPLGPVPAGSRYLEIAQAGWSQAGHVAYLRLTPLAEADIAEFGRGESRPDRSTERRPLVATEDANGFVAGFGAFTEDDIRQQIECFRDTDFRAVHWCLFGADLTSYHTDVGTMVGETGECTLDPITDRIFRCNRFLADKGINPLRVARDWAREIGIEFHLSQRTQCFSLHAPFEEYYSSRFFATHPQFRCVDRDGTITAQMSYAHPEVRRHLVDVMVEAQELAGGVDGANLLGARGGPLALFEEPVIASFPSGRGPADEENEEFLRHRAGFFTQYMRELRDALKVPLNVTIYANRLSNLQYGLDPEAWAQEGLVDALMVYPLGYTDICHTFEVPIEASFLNRLSTDYGIPWYALPSVKGSRLEDIVLAAREAYQDGAHGLYFWDAAVWMAQRPSTFEVNRRLGHLDWVMSVADEDLPRFRWERFKKLGDFNYGRHASWMGF